MAVTITVASGDTLSSIAAQHGVSLSAIESANASIKDPNAIYVGETVIVPSGGSWAPAPSSSSDSGGGGTSGGGSSSSGGGSGFQIPGVSSAVAACIAFRESTNGQASANVFQISNYYPGESLAAQEAAAGQIAATQGVHNAWGVYDGCA